MKTKIDLKFGDCFTEVLNMGGNSVDAVITDPLYNLDANSKKFLLTEFFRICGGHILIFCQPENLWAAPNYLFWVKPTSTKNFSRSHGRFVEMIAHFPRGKIFNSNTYWANMTGVYFDILEGERIHQYQKPLSLIERLIKIHTMPGDTVFDGFAGSGTTAVASKRLDRNFIGFENDKVSYQLALDRIKGN